MKMAAPEILTNYLIVVIITITLMISSSSSSSSSSTLGNNKLKAIELINSTCECTEHQELCRWSLYPYALLLLKHPCHLPFVAVKATLEDAKNASRYVREAMRMPNHAGNHSVTAALHDCAENLDEVVGEIGDSLNQTQWLYTGNEYSTNNCSSLGEEFNFHVANLKTWMSAALTGEVTCADELKYMDDPLRSNVRYETSRVQMLVSNALALINKTFN